MANKNKTKINFSPLATFYLLKKMSSFPWELVQGEPEPYITCVSTVTTSILVIFVLYLRFMTFFFFQREHLLQEQVTKFYLGSDSAWTQAHYF